MSENDTPSTRATTRRAADHDSRPVRLDQGHIGGAGGLPERFAEPRPPAARPPAGRPRREGRPQARREAGRHPFGALDPRRPWCSSSPTSPSPTTTSSSSPASARRTCSNVALGVDAGRRLLGIGLGAVHWAKTLMPDEEIVEERHPLRSSDAAAQAAVDIVYEGGEGPARPPPAHQVHPGRRARAVRPPPPPPAGRRPRPAAAELRSRPRSGARAFGSCATRRSRRSRPPTSPSARSSTSCPRASTSRPRHPRGRRPRPPCSSCASTPSDIKSPKAQDWGYDGIVAYSKICTHVGCPVGLYEQQTHHLLCPCHQSTFDVTEDCKVIFGPAKRPLPQLKITVDDEGYLVGPEGFHEAVGPSFWERG